MSDHDDDVDAQPPVDLAAVQADDALLDLMGGMDASVSSSDTELSGVLLAWRRDMDAEAIGDLVDTDTAVAVIARARRPRQPRHRLIGPFAAAAAVLVIAFSGVGLAAKSAEPGDRLWGLTEVLYSDYAQSVQAAAAVRTDLESARSALEAGRPDEARQILERAKNDLATVREDEGHSQLERQHQELTVELGQRPDGGSQATRESQRPGSEQNQPEPAPIAPASPTPSESPSEPDPTTPSESTSSPPPSEPSTGDTPGGAQPGSEPTPQSSGGTTPESGGIQPESGGTTAESTE